MHIKHTNLDNEITAAIDASIVELTLAGIDASDAENKPLIMAAIKFYCDSHIGYRSDADRYEKAYEKLKATLSLAGGE